MELNKPFDYWENYQYFLLFVPILVGFISSFGYNLKNVRLEKASPKPYVFSIVWTILYILIGISLTMNISYYMSETVTEGEKTYGKSMTSKDSLITSCVFYGFLIFCLCMWPYTFGKNQRYALFLLAFCILFTILCMIMNPVVSNLCMTPLLTWLLFALLLNYSKVNR